MRTLPAAMPSVLVVGAGLSGIVCALRLHLSGLSVQLVDKSRGVGGRMSTRREAPWSFDHGAPYVQANSATMRDAFRGYEQQGLLARHGDAWVGVPGMNALPRWLAFDRSAQLRRPLPIVLGATAHLVERRGGRWTTTCLDGTTHESDVLALAIPAPQAVALLQRSAVERETDGHGHGATDGPESVAVIAAALGAVEMAPCWSVMLAVRGKEIGERDESSLPALPSLGDAGIRIHAQHSRPGRSPQHAYVIQASGPWSVPRLEYPPSDIEALVREAVAVDQPTWHVEHLRAHRWRFAQVTRGLANASLWHTESASGACGDWGALGIASGSATDAVTASGIERAMVSGGDLAMRILAQVGVPAVEVLAVE